MSLFKSWVWPDVSVRRKAQSAINEAFGAAILLTILCTILAFVPTSSPTDSNDRQWFLLSAILFGALSVGIFLRSRVAAASALLFFTTVIAYSALSQGPRYLIPRAIVFVAFLNGARGAFAYHKLPPKPVGLPSIQQSFQSVRPSSPSNDEPSRPSS